MRFFNKIFSNESGVSKALFLFLELLCTIVFSVIAVYMYRNGDAIFGGFFLPLVIKVFCFYTTMGLWEKLYKNIFPSKIDEPEKEEKKKPEIIEPNDDDITPRAPDFDD